MLSLIYYKVQNFLTVYPLLYAPTTERSEFKKYFSISFILIGFFFNKYKFVFVLNFGQRGLWGECQKFKTPYFYIIAYFDKIMQKVYNFGIIK